MRHLLFLPLFLAATAAMALQSAGISIEKIEGAGWQAQGLTLSFRLRESDSGQLQIRSLQLPEPLGEIRDLRLDCAELIFRPQRIACLDAPLTADWALLDKPGARASFDYAVSTGVLQLRLQQLSALGGQLLLRLTLGNEGWQAEAEIDSLQAAAVAPLLAAFGQAISADTGRLQVQLRASGDEVRQGIDYRLKLSGLTASDVEGNLASEGLALELSGQASTEGQDWRTELSLALMAGQLYANPLFIDAGERPLALSGRLRYRPDGRTLSFEQLQLEHRDTLVLRAEGSLQLGETVALQALHARIEQARLAAAYPVYLQPFLLGSGLDELQAEGRISGEVRLRNGAPQLLQLQLSEVTAHDAKQRFSLDALNGELHWREQLEQAPETRLQWSGGTAYKLPFTAAQLRLRIGGKALRLLEPLHLPVLGGALNVDRLAVDEAGSEAMWIDFDGALAPLSLTELTRALGWPEFAGTLGGQLPDLSYREGNLTVGGTLAAEVFDGSVSVQGLHVAEPFGRLPRLRADLRLRNLDLKQATSAFQFGAIEGRLSGDVTGLRMLNWQPVSFDARLYTPEDDRSRHRISQRAIENISSLGGAGAGAALSRGFMRFFENFAYDRLGISCRLTNGVCLMGGIEDAPDKAGYYLVKGKLLPRIDVIGFAREVSWPALIEQLRAISEGEGPEVR